MKLLNAYRDLSVAFREAKLATPELDARVLLANLTGQTSAQIPFGETELDASQLAKLSQWRARRLKHESVARITGSKGFWTLELEVSPATLEPRPDSETLIEAALEQLGTRRDENLKILDLGTGTGALLLALLSECKNASGIGMDISCDALQTAKRNAQAARLSSRAQFVCGSWFDALKGKFDLIVSNPPYIPSADLQKLGPEVRLYDPVLSLDGGQDGFSAYRTIATQAAGFLNHNGILLLEAGYDQGKAVASLFGALGYRNLGIKPDLSGHQRVVMLAPKTGKSADREVDKKHLEKRLRAAKTMSAPLNDFEKERAQRFIPGQKNSGPRLRSRPPLSSADQVKLTND